MIQIAMEASKCGMRAIAFKDHWNMSATSADLTQRYIDDMIARGELGHRVEVYGGVGMCFGMRPEYVRVGLQYPNFKMIWVPDLHLLRLLARCRPSGKGRRAPGGRRRQSVAGSERDHGNGGGKKVGIGFGDTDFQELLPLARLAKEIGSERPSIIRC